MAVELRHRTIATNGIRLHAVEAGPADGRLLILLHGFPELWASWRRHIEPLAAAGFRVLVPDQRGYNLSDKPRGIASYRLDRLARDVVGLIDDAGRERACLVGHDWGGAVAWWVGVNHPQRLERLALLNIPHPYVMRRHLRHDRAQIRKSWYIFFFQLPWLPEAYWRRRNWEAGVRALTVTSRRGTFSAADLAVYREAWSQPGAITGMIHWYRAALRRPPPRPASPRVRVPVLLLWGKGDRFLGAEMAQPSIDLCDDGRLIYLDATHWLHHEEPAEVRQRLADFFGAREAAAQGFEASV
ncbi:MAG TPA: alpha/beta fold hydrolase [Thermoanaerobaculia bacterium]|jgi:pimeloyl-ACP methyl ester carboxylesterase|nr:alpha/beta fold hydrolase [Thermoanaerobaculia bacterium]